MKEYEVAEQLTMRWETEEGKAKRERILTCMKEGISLEGISLEGNVEKINGMFDLRGITFAEYKYFSSEYGLRKSTYITMGFDNILFENIDFSLRIGIEVRNERICVRDLYDLMEWSSGCPASQYIRVDNGFYHITLCGNRPCSGILGDDQEINVYLNKLDEMPTLRFAGAPMFCG